MTGMQMEPTSDERLEVVTIPVSDVERAKEFYTRIGWRQDHTPPGKFQFTPPGSWCSIQFGAGLTTAAPGSAQRMYLCVPDIAATRERLSALGVEVGEYFHTGGPSPEPGLHPERASYRSHFPFTDPDGNSYLVQEVTSRLPGRIDPGPTTFTSVDDLARALRRAATAHDEHKKPTGETDTNWADWYAAFLASEQFGEQPPV
ncbi:VOC family protein [Streptomyces sp. NPDC093516]|uniref:VOC family protein n=1 Tax=Streptomyces sp. NPDC093516 TaxID=3155304 RepID=UPI00341E8277